MTRAGRHHSSSGGSLVEFVTTKPNSSVVPGNGSANRKPAAAPDAARQLMEIVLNLRDSSGKVLLHQLSRGEDGPPNSSLEIGQKLLRRASELDAASGSPADGILSKLVLQTDRESGYAPLHWAVLDGDLASILLLLREVMCVSGGNQRLVQRPIHLLEGDYQADPILLQMVLGKDWEGMTPLDLLGSLQRATLKTCRDSLPSPKVIPPSNNNRRNRSPSFEINDEQNEFSQLCEGIRGGILEEDVQNSSCSQGCEVLTFGRANHCALGVSDASSANQKNRPQRVQAFALSDRGALGSAVAVSAASHHTLVVTRSGALYSFGLGKGGRLGTGDERHTPLPTRVLSGISNRKVVNVAAAENHSLCVTSDGYVYAWGSNRFGQLGINEESSSFRPKRVEDLRGMFCVSIAAADKHSVALTRDGQVYTWGDNSAGQLGTTRRSGVQRVEALWNAQPRKVAMAIAASERSTLALICPVGGGIPVNSVIAWGHGNCLPTKVNFDTKRSAHSMHSRHQRPVNPISIACAKYHSVAITDDGCVYTWGLHSDQLGTKGRESKSTVIASPQIVSGMLPENGGGIAVAVSATENHTAVVTETGHLFTWGFSEQDLLGHEGVRFQPSPKRVSGVHRVVGVAAAKEHTVLLVGTTIPSIPPVVQGSSLENLAARRVARHVDLFNAIPILIMAERAQCSFLIQYCIEFVKCNLDGVLTLGRKSEMNTYLNEQLAEPHSSVDRDGNVHPLIREVLYAGSSDGLSWMEGCQNILSGIPISTLVRYQQSTEPRRRQRAASFHNQKAQAAELGKNRSLQAGFQGCSDHCLMITSNLDDLKSPDEILAKHGCLTKEIRGSRKRLNQIAKLEKMNKISTEEREKLSRRPLIEGDLALFQSALAKVTRMMEHRNMTISSLPGGPQGLPEEKKAPPADVREESHEIPNFCALCGVHCPDENALEIHKSGRKHRNRVVQVEEEEKKRAAETMAEEKRNKPAASSREDIPSQKKTTYAASVDGALPRYTLPPPPHPPGPLPVKLTWADSKSPKTVQESPRSFRQILEQEEKMKSASSKEPRTPRKTVKNTKASSPILLNPGEVPPLKSPPWVAAPVARVASNPLSSPTATKATVALGQFLKTPSPEKQEKNPLAPWSAKPMPVTEPVTPTTPQTPTKSLLEIQEEEEAYRQQTKSAISGGKWFIQRTERANSFSAIQQEAEQERERIRILEEQKRLEEEIEEERRKKIADTKKNNNRRRTKNKKKGKTNPSKEQQSGNPDASSGSEPLQRSNRASGQTKANASKEPTRNSTRQ